MESSKNESKPFAQKIKEIVINSNHYYVIYIETKKQIKISFPPESHANTNQEIYHLIQLINLPFIETISPVDFITYIGNNLNFIIFAYNQIDDLTSTYIDKDKMAPYTDKLIEAFHTHALTKSTCEEYASSNTSDQLVNYLYFKHCIIYREEESQTPNEEDFHIIKTLINKVCLKQLCPVTIDKLKHIFLKLEAYKINEYIITFDCSDSYESLIHYVDIFRYKDTEGKPKEMVKDQNESFIKKFGEVVEKNNYMCYKCLKKFIRENIISKEDVIPLIHKIIEEERKRRTEITHDGNEQRPPFPLMYILTRLLQDEKIDVGKSLLSFSNDNIDMPISLMNDNIENTPTPTPSGVTTHIEINEDFMISLLFTLTKEAPIIKIFDYLTQQNILHRLYLPRNTNLKNLILSRQFQLLQYFCSQNFFTSKYRKFTSSLYCIETMKIINGIRERIEFLEINYTDVAELNKLNENDLNTFMKTLSLNNEKIYESLEQNLKKIINIFTNLN